MRARHPARPDAARSPLWCAAALALSALVAGAPAVAQTGSPGSIEACQQDHFEPARYLADLEAAGWATATGDDRAMAVAAIADAFFPVLDFDTDDAEMMRAEARAFWEAETAGRLVMVRPGAALFVAGALSSDGRRSVECWMALEDGTLPEGLIARADNIGEIDPDQPLFVVIGPEPLDERRDFTVIATRHPAPAGVTLAASYGMMTRTEFLPSD